MDTKTHELRHTEIHTDLDTQKCLGTDTETHTHRRTWIERDTGTWTQTDTDCPDKEGHRDTLTQGHS